MKWLWITCMLVGSANAQVIVDDYILPGEKDHGIGINRAMARLDSMGHGTLEFTGSRDYKVLTPIELPRYATNGKRLFVINGNGCRIVAKQDSISIFRAYPQGSEGGPQPNDGHTISYQ